MPWYTDPNLTCRVLERIISRYPDCSMGDLRSGIEKIIEQIWQKRESFYAAGNCNHTTLRNHSRVDQFRKSICI